MQSITDTSPIESLRVENEIRRTVTQVVAGVLAAVGVALAISEFAMRERTQLNSEYTKAVQSLGSSDVSQHRMAFATLALICQDSPSIRDRAISTICLYLRNETPDKQAAIDCLAEVMRHGRTERAALNLQDADLSGLELRELDLSYANLRSVRLLGSLVRNVLFTSATIDGAFLSDAVFRNSKFDGASLRGAELLRCRFVELCTFRGADFSDAVMQYADLSHADLTGANLTGCKAQHATFSEAVLNEAVALRADFEDAILVGTSWHGADLALSILRRARMHGADLTRSRNLSLPQFRLALFNATTRLPEYLDVTKLEEKGE
jgi:uncharacterized protein YjbI with pentapeptide repeats